jgi:cephalosporin hydroxylase
MPTEPALPSPARVELSAPVGELWLKRIRQAVHDTYMGVPLRKLPEDLRVYEHVMWLSGCDTVIELGTNMGGSTLWFRDRLATLATYGRIERPAVISVDRATAEARANLDAADPEWQRTVTLIDGDVRDPGLVDEVRALVRPGARCLVSEDTAHTYESTRAALRGFAQFVPPGGFFVVEDGCVDVEEMRPTPAWPRGVLPAIREWLADEGGEFSVRRELELYGLTSNVDGYLQRASA